MARMTWFWRLVCSPDCSEACQVSCPGCAAMAPRWQSQGIDTPAARRPAAALSWSNFRIMWGCWSRSVTARAVARLNPARLFGRAPAARPRAAGCGCGPATAAVPPGQAAAVGCCGPAAAVSPGGVAAAGCGCGPAAATADRREAIAAEVGRYYAQQAERVSSGCGDDCCTPALDPRVSATGSYEPADLGNVPVEAVLASLGCGNPLARADLAPGEVVLDLGSGGGMDVLVAAGRVGPTGRVIGLDMSEEMLALARANAARVGAANVEFRRGDLESVPLPDASVDVIISNCVVNLAPDKERALREAHRVLRPGGRLAISDIVTRDPVPAELKDSLTAWAACIGGALSEDEYRRHLTGAGFVDVVVERDREYTAADAEAAGLAPVLAGLGLDVVTRLGFASTSVRARRPAEPTEESTPDSESAPVAERAATA